MNRWWWLLLLLGVVASPSATSAAQLTLTWQDNSAGQASFSIERELATGAYTRIAQVGPGVVSYSDSTVFVGSTYCYRVSAVNAVGESAYSNVACGSPVATRITLTVSKSGPGVVDSTPAGIACGSVCAATYPVDAVIFLTATPNKNAHFTGWTGGGCSGIGLCVVTLTGPVTVTASFSKGRGK